MKPPRGLSAEEAQAWEQVARTVTPLVPVPFVPDQTARTDRTDLAAPVANPQPLPVRQAVPSPRLMPAAVKPVPNRRDEGLDSHWERRLKGGALQPDFTLDLHGYTLDGAYGRLMDGLAQARSLQARVVLVITGIPRKAEAADRGASRGAIRAKVLDWLAASGHASAIAAIRKAHIRHGGNGALYIVLKRGR